MLWLQQIMRKIDVQALNLLREKRYEAKRIIHVAQNFMAD